MQVIRTGVQSVIKMNPAIFTTPCLGKTARLSTLARIQSGQLDVL
jgi:hypothetical protein